MIESEASALVAFLMAAWPRGSWPDSTRQVYARSLAGFTEPEARRAIERLVSTVDFQPSIAELRRAIVSDRLGLPSDVEAWELAVRHAAARRGLEPPPCIACCGMGTRLASDEACPACQGRGIGPIDLHGLPPVPEPIPRAAAFVGGWQTIREAERPEFLRRDFLDVYRRLASETSERENLRLLGVVDDLAIEASSRTAAEILAERR